MIIFQIITIIVFLCIAFAKPEVFDYLVKGLDHKNILIRFFYFILSLWLLPASFVILLIALLLKGIKNDTDKNQNKEEID